MESDYNDICAFFTKLLDGWIRAIHTLQKYFGIRLAVTFGSDLGPRRFGLRST